MSTNQAKDSQCQVPVGGIVLPKQTWLQLLEVIEVWCFADLWSKLLLLQITVYVFAVS